MSDIWVFFEGKYLFIKNDFRNIRIFFLNKIIVKNKNLLLVEEISFENGSVIFIKCFKVRNLIVYFLSFIFFVFFIFL